MTESQLMDHEMEKNFETYGKDRVSPELYQTTPQNITLHLKAIYQEGELDPQATCKKFLQVQGLPGGFPSPKIPAHIG